MRNISQNDMEILDEDSTKWHLSLRVGLRTPGWRMNFTLAILENWIIAALIAEV